jgi:MscS family membrane protein
LAILAITFIAANVLVFIYDRILSKIVKKTNTKYDDLFVQKTKIPLLHILYMLGAMIALRPLGLNETLYNLLVKIITSLVLLIFTLLASRVVCILIDVWGYKWAKRTKSTIDNDLVPLFKKTVRVVIFIAGIIIVVGAWGIDVTGLLAGAGIAGLILGFALQDSLKNIFGGISLILDQSLKVGDKVKLETGEKGEIIDIGLRSTKIRTYDNQTIIVPNSQLANVSFFNYARPNLKERINLKFSVAYGSDIDKVKKIVLDVIEKHPKVVKNPDPMIALEAMGESSLNFIARAWVADYSDEEDVRFELTDSIYRVLVKNKVDIPFPTQTIYLKKE